MGTWTIWGEADYTEKITRGIVWYGTGSHGGYHVSSTMLKKMPYPLASIGEPDGVGGAWFEEDCDWAAVVYSFPEHFPPKLIRKDGKDVLYDQYGIAAECLANYHWRAWEEATDIILKPGQSHSKDEWLFYTENKDRWITTSAIFSTSGKYKREGYTEVTAELGGGQFGYYSRRGKWDNTFKQGKVRMLLVPSTEYYPHMVVSDGNLPVFKYEEVSY